METFPEGVAFCAGTALLAIPITKKNRASLETVRDMITSSLRKQILVDNTRSHRACILDFGPIQGKDGFSSNQEIRISKSEAKLESWVSGFRLQISSFHAWNFAFRVSSFFRIDSSFEIFSYEFLGDPLRLCSGHALRLDARYINGFSEVVSAGYANLVG
jgi:hypothetical protein